MTMTYEVFNLDEEVEKVCRKHHLISKYLKNGDVIILDNDGDFNGITLAEIFLNVIVDCDVNSKVYENYIVLSEG